MVICLRGFLSKLNNSWPMQFHDIYITCASQNMNASRIVLTHLDLSVLVQLHLTHIIAAATTGDSSNIKPTSICQTTSSMMLLLLERYSLLQEEYSEKNQVNKVGRDGQLFELFNLVYDINARHLMRV